MKWFKHYSDMHRGRSINDLLDQLGHTGLCFFLLQEMCAEKLEKDDQGLTEADCSWTFHTRIVRQNLRISPVNLVRLLDACAMNGLLSFEFSGSSLTISMPILLNLLERNTKRARKTRTTSAQKSPLDKDIDKEEERDKEKELQISKTKRTKQAQEPAIAIAQPPSKSNFFIAKYCTLFKNKYGSNPEIDGRTAGIALRVSKNLTEEKINLYLEAFFKMPDSGLVKSKHPLNFFEMKLNEVVVFANSGAFTTQTQARQMDQSASTFDMLQQIREGKL